MYQINRDTNQLQQLSKKQFAELGFREREHLQEWLVKTPTALGEELLIIQKEFDGFDETRERLDLLALDKQGRLVLIENKLDDSGRDVVWQSLKYASYCSSLTKAQIVDIFQAYLDKYCGGGNATELICEFLEADDFSDVILNSGVEQRIKLVAANFRREVTSTALWLLKYGLSIECYKATAYQFGESLLLNIEQIIPTPEAEDFMIGISEKEKEEKTVERSRSNAASLRLSFWEQLIQRMQSENHPRFQSLNPSKDHWLSIGSGLGGAIYSLIYSKFEVRVDFYLMRSEQEDNKKAFDILNTHKEEIENRFGQALEWQRLDDKKACRIKYSKPFDGYNKENWPEMVDWIAKHLPKFEAAFTPHLDEIRQALKA